MRLLFASRSSYPSRRWRQTRPTSSSTTWLRDAPSGSTTEAGRTIWFERVAVASSSTPIRPLQPGKWPCSSTMSMLSGPRVFRHGNSLRPSSVERTGSRAAAHPRGRRWSGSQTSRQATVTGCACRCDCERIDSFADVMPKRLVAASRNEGPRLRRARFGIRVWPVSRPGTLGRTGIVARKAGVDVVKGYSGAICGSIRRPEGTPGGLRLHVLDASGTVGDHFPIRFLTRHEPTAQRTCCWSRHGHLPDRCGLVPPPLPRPIQIRFFRRGPWRCCDGFSGRFCYHSCFPACW